ncbi:MAG: hypothetical protein LBD55_01125 [Treponema sp.]|nr:hypothetical protein [Treponema sp.]
MEIRANLWKSVKSVDLGIKAHGLTRISTDVVSVEIREICGPVQGKPRKAAEGAGNP